jgi:hypothetical protein
MGERLFQKETCCGKENEMSEKRVLCPERVRTIKGSFSFLEHRFLRDGFWETLDHDALLFYVFLVLVGDRKGLSYYPYDKISNLLKITVDDYIAARNDLIKKDLIAFDGRLFQVLSLPETPAGGELHPITDMDEMKKRDPATIHQIIHEALSR